MAFMRALLTPVADFHGCFLRQCYHYHSIQSNVYCLYHTHKALYCQQVLALMAFWKWIVVETFLLRYYVLWSITVYLPISFLNFAKFQSQRVLWFHHHQYVSMSVGKHVFCKTAHRIFLKLLMKLVCLKGKKLAELDFLGKISFWG